MQKLIDDGKQVDSVVTDPPYHLTSIVERYGKEGSANLNPFGKWLIRGSTAANGVG